MREKRLLLFFAAFIGLAPESMAQPPDLFLEHLADFQWSGVVDNNWRVEGNWIAPSSPPPPTGVVFPNDPGRIDMDEQTIDPVVGASFSSALAGDLTVTIAGGNVTVAAVKLGGTGPAVTTDITSAANLLIFENFELNDETTNPGDPTADPPIEPEPIFAFNQGNALIWSTGTAAAGKENRISANIKINDDVDVEGDRDLHVFGDIIEADPGQATKESLSSFLTGGAWLHLRGNIQTTLMDEDGNSANGVQDRILGLNGERGIPVPEDFQNPPPEVTRQGNMDIHGQFVGEGRIEIGSSQGNLLPIGTVILRADNVGPSPGTPIYDGRILINRGNLVLDHDNALGGGDFVTSNPNQGFGFNFMSTSDDRNIDNELQIAQWHTVRGASDVEALDGMGMGDHSIEFSGRVQQSNTRGWINLLTYDFVADTGPTLTISGPQFPLEGGDNQDSDRIYTIDGSGKTMVTGGIHDRPPLAIFSGRGHFRKRGAGTVVIDFDEAHTEDSATDYGGYTWMQGGNLHFVSNNDLPDPGDINGMPTEILSSGGAIGFDEGVFSNNAGNFLSQLNNSSNPNWGLGSPTGTQSPFFRTFQLATAVFTRYDHGGLMLAADEYDNDLNFNSGNLANAANMTLAAWESSSTYTGTITPSTSTAVNPNTYLLGGGAGTLTLPNANQLTGQRNLIVDNGGEVRLTNTNNYSGSTLVRGNFDPSLTASARGNQPGAENNEQDIREVGGQSYSGTTLTVTNLTDGNSSIGNSTAAADLHIQGATLKYDGGAVTTNRLFTVGTAGATIDASGSGPLVFSNTGALVMDVAENREGIVASSVPGGQTLEIFGIPSFTNPGSGSRVVFDTSDLVPGMAVRDLGPNNLTADDDDEILVTNVMDPHAIEVAEADVDDEADPPEVPFQFPAGTFITSFDFGPAPARTLTLSGENTGNNTLAPLIGDAADKAEASADQLDDGFGTVGVTKQGAGTWILANAANSYTGNTEVEEGTLGGLSFGAGNTISSATIAPGMSTGELTIGRDFTQNETGTLEIEINGAEDFDTVSVGGDAILDGTLAVILGFTPTANDTFTVLTANSLAQSLVLSGPDGGAFDLSASTATELILTFLGAGGIPGDYNDDGLVDAADYTVWRNSLGGASLPNEGASIGVVDQADYDFWKSRFGATAAVGSAAAVPEPAHLLLYTLLLLGACRPPARRIYELRRARIRVAFSNRHERKRLGMEAIVMLN